MREIKVGDKILYKYFSGTCQIYTIKKINRYPTEYWVLEERGYFSENIKTDSSATLLDV